MDDIGAITFQINTSIKVIFPDKSTEVLHVHSDKTEILINNENEIKQDIRKHIDNIKYKFENQSFKKSGGSIKSIGKIRLMISQYKPLRGSSYFPLPEKIKNTRSCINIKNEDDQGFKYCVQCVVHGILNKPHPENMYHYKKLDCKLDFSMLSYPVKIFDIHKFEKKNNISISVTGVNDKGSYVPLYISKINNASINVDLLLVNDKNKWHYVLVRNFDRLVGSQWNSHIRRTHFCRTCYHGFSSAEVLKNHIENGCVKMEGSQIVLPEKGDVMQFENCNNKFRHPFVIYSDFECGNRATRDEKSGYMCLTAMVFMSALK